MAMGASGAQVKHLSFNQDRSCFTCAESTGFRAYSCSTGKPIINGPALAKGGAQSASMMYNSGYIAVVGDGSSPLHPTDKVLVWSNAANSFIIELQFQEVVLGTRFRKNRLIIITRRELHIYEFSPSRPEQLTKIATGENPSGVCAVSPSEAAFVLAVPAVQDGCVKVLTFSDKRDCSLLHPELILTAHANPLCCIALNDNGTLMATASKKGTCVRIFDTVSGENIRQLRRGTEPANVMSMNFNADSSRLIVASHKSGIGSTVHVFALTEDDSFTNRQSLLSSFRNWLPEFFSSEWSFAQYHSKEPQMICAFAETSDTFYVVDYSGSIRLFALDAKAETKCRETSVIKYLQQR